MKKTQLIVAACLASVLLGIMSGTAAAQAAAQDIARIRKVSGSKVKTPDFKVSGYNTSGSARDWFAVMVEFDTAPEWTEQLDFTFYVVLQGKDPKYQLLRGTVSCVNIPRGSRHKEVMYLHPTTLGRYGSVYRAGVEIRHKGVPVAVESSDSGKGRWWEDPNLLPSVKDGLVLNRLQTPFAFLQYDEYEAINPAPAK